MNSIYKRIENLVKVNKLTTFSLVAKTVLDDFNNGIFRDQLDLAVICFVSKSTITQFSKAVLCSGYRELVVRLKIEYENNFLSLNENKIKQLKHKTFDNLKNWISVNDIQINTLSNMIKESEKIYLFSSYQTNIAKEYFSEILLEKNYEVITADISKNLKWFKNIEIKNNYLFIFIISGRDTSTIFRTFEHFVSQESKIFLIVSNNWTENLKEIQNKEIIYFDNINFSKNFVDRIYQLISLFKIVETKL